MALLPSKGDQTELKASFKKPPKPIIDTFSALLCLLGHPKKESEDVLFAQKISASSNLHKRMSEFDPKSMTPAKYAYVTTKIASLTPDVVRNVSRAGLAYYMWVKNTADALPAEVKVTSS